MIGWPGNRPLSVVVVATSCLLASVAVASPTHGATRKPAIRVLDSLPVAPERSIGYQRELFQHWIDADGDGCDTRDEVLMDEAVAGHARGCDVLGGQWLSLYDEVVTDDAGSLDIDHMVPLKEAWDSGAWRWDARVRKAFANDLGYRGSLVAVTASSNRSKSDQDPAEWLPRTRVCSYAKQWIAVKYRWRLAVDAVEKSALTRILRTCARMMNVPALAAR